MKAEILECEICDGVIGFTHGNFYDIKRILVPEANNLVITIDAMYGENIYVWDNFQKDETCKLFKEIDIPDEFVKKTTEFLGKKMELFAYFEKLLS